MHRRPGIIASFAILALAGHSSAGRAQGDRAFTVTGGMTAVVLSGDNSAIAADQTLSADLNLEWRTRSGQWLAYIESNSSLDEQAISARLAEANADAATAVDADNNGRVQLSGLMYTLMRPRARLTLGLIDPSSYLDRSRITNDENVQFLGLSFVNNPTIEFPDYTLGVAYEREAQGTMPQLNMVVAGSNGLADNRNRSYRQLLRVDGDQKGMFAALGARWARDDNQLRLGAWLNTRDHETLRGDSQDATNYGVYAVLGRLWGRHGLNLRLGLARPEVSSTSEFVSLAYRMTWRRHALGAGIARSFLSPQAQNPTFDDATQLELYARFTLSERVHLTVSMQRLENSGFASVSTTPGRPTNLAGLRLYYAF